MWRLTRWVAQAGMTTGSARWTCRAGRCRGKWSAVAHTRDGPPNAAARTRRTQCCGQQGAGTDQSGHLRPHPIEARRVLGVRRLDPADRDIEAVVAIPRRPDQPPPLDNDLPAIHDSNTNRAGRITPSSRRLEINRRKRCHCTSSRFRSSSPVAPQFARGRRIKPGHYPGIGRSRRCPAEQAAQRGPP